MVGCIAIGTIALHFLESLSWIDAFHLSITFVITGGYGDFAFTIIIGKYFAIIRLLINTSAVVRNFIHG